MFEWGRVVIDNENNVEGRGFVVSTTAYNVKSHSTLFLIPVYIKPLASVYNEVMVIFLVFWFGSIGMSFYENDNWCWFLKLCCRNCRDIRAPRCAFQRALSCAACVWWCIHTGCRNTHHSASQSLNQL